MKKYLKILADYAFTCPLIGEEVIKNMADLALMALLLGEKSKKIKEILTFFQKQGFQNAYFSPYIVGI